MDLSYFLYLRLIIIIEDIRNVSTKHQVMEF